MLSDVSGDIAAKFGVPVRKGGSFTRTIDGEEVTLERAHSPARWTFILDDTGTIVYKNQNVNLSEDSQKVLEIVEQLEK